MDELRKAYRITVIIGLAIMASLVVYLIIAGLMESGALRSSEGPALTGSVYETVQFVLLGASAVIFFLIRLIGGQVLHAKGEQAKKPEQRSFAPGISPEFGRLATAAIITYALCEAPAIFGLVLYFLGRRIMDFYLFLLISFFFFATSFPRYDQWEEWYRKQRDGGTRR